MSAGLFRQPRDHNSGDARQHSDTVRRALHVDAGRCIRMDGYVVGTGNRFQQRGSRLNSQSVMSDLRISKERRAEWRPLIEGYLRHSQELRGIVQLLDVRHDPTEDDRGMFDFLADVGLPTIVALTKVDKLGSVKRVEQIAAISAHLGLDPATRAPTDNQEQAP